MSINVQKLIGEIATRNCCRVEASDPIFAVTTITELMLDEVVEGLLVRIRVAITEFESSARAVEAHAGKVLGEQMRNSTSEWKAEIAKDLNIANARCCELIDKIHRAHTRPAMQRWGALGAFAAMLFLGCGIFIGFYFR
jgi:hypothetical protein